MGITLTPYMADCNWLQLKIRPYNRVNSIVFKPFVCKVKHFTVLVQQYLLNILYNFLRVFGLNQF
jgi:hypothetical protein